MRSRSSTAPATRSCLRSRAERGGRRCRPLLVPITGADHNDAQLLDGDDLVSAVVELAGNLRGYPGAEGTEVDGRRGRMERTFTLEEARALLPELCEVAADLVAVRADLMELQTSLANGWPSPLGGRAEVKALRPGCRSCSPGFLRGDTDPRLGAAAARLPFAAVRRGGVLCWLEGDEAIAWYHRPEHGFAGRRRLPADTG